MQRTGGLCKRSTEVPGGISGGLFLLRRWKINGGFVDCGTNHKNFVDGESVCGCDSGFQRAAGECAAVVGWRRNGNPGSLPDDWRRV